MSQERLFPNKNWVNHRRLHEETFTMKWWVIVDTTSKEIGSIKTVVKVLKRDGKVRVIQQIRQPESPAKWIDSTLVNLYDFSPVYHSSTNDQRSMRLIFTRNNVDVFYQAPGKAPLASKETVTGGFFDSNFYPFFFQWLDVYEGYSAQINIYDYTPEKHGVLKAYLRNSEEVEYKSDRGDQTRAWKLTVQDEIVKNATTYYYVAVKDRRLLEIEVDMGTTKMKMIRD